jgi:hypothetical protein
MSFFNTNIVGFRRVYYETGLLKAQANCRGSLRSLDSPYLSKELPQASALRGTDNYESMKTMELSGGWEN